VIKYALRRDIMCSRVALTRADALFAVSYSYLKWGIDNGGRDTTEWNRVFYLGYPNIAKMSILEKESESAIPSLLQGNGHDKFIIFIGSFGVTYDFKPIIEVARRMLNVGRNELCFVLAGDGEQFEAVRKDAEGLSNVVLPGWINSKDIHYLLKKGYAGLLSYTKDAPQSLSYKPFEYLSGGLPLISSLKGEMAELIDRHGLGLSYQAGNSEGLYKCIDMFLNNPGMRDEMSANASDFFMEHCDADKIYSDYSVHVEKLVKAYRTGRRIQ
jgi:glycosyltransferase involved in cell wall biosynthesis